MASRITFCGDLLHNPKTAASSTQELAFPAVSQGKPSANSSVHVALPKRLTKHAQSSTRLSNFALSLPRRYLKQNNTLARTYQTRLPFATGSSRPRRRKKTSRVCDVPAETHDGWVALSLVQSR
jgi:hypothetical protein